MVQQGELEEAVAHYHQALQLDPHNRDLGELLREAEARLAELNTPTEESPQRTDSPADEALSGTALMSVPAFGREVLEPADTEEHRRWLHKMTRGSEGQAGDPDETCPDPEEDDPEGETGPEEAGSNFSPTKAHNPGPGSEDPHPDTGDALDDAHLSPEETELLRAEQDGHTSTGPPRGMATATLAEIYFQQGYLDKAIEIYQKVLRHDPGDEKSRARLSELRAMRSSRSEQPDPAPAEERTEEQTDAAPPQGEPSP
jgi:tetratricopeptide (TPR) repeat protein